MSIKKLKIALSSDRITDNKVLNIQVAKFQARVNVNYNPQYPDVYKNHLANLKRNRVAVKSLKKKKTAWHLQFALSDLMLFLPPVIFRHFHLKFLKMLHFTDGFFPRLERS